MPVHRERNIDGLFFVLGWDWCRFDIKHAGTHYAELMFLHPVESLGDIVHFSVFEV
jgi:hypothetical protein